MRHVALLRGINVGKAKRIAMVDLRAVFEGLGCIDVATLLNSGNVVFTPPKKGAARLEARVQEAIATETGVSCRVVILTGEEVMELVNGEPFGDQARAEASRLFVCVLANPADRVKANVILAQDFAPEKVALGRRAIYFHCPMGVRDSAAMKQIEKTFRGEITSRNWATLQKLQLLISRPG